MIKEDEKRFLRIMQKDGWAHIRKDGKLFPLPNRTMPREIIARESNWLNEKRALYLLEKWDGKGWFEYGTVVDGGWLTPKGMEIAV
jgi:hypothetical protein